MMGVNGAVVRNDGIGFILKKELAEFDDGLERRREREESRMTPTFLY